ncbi:hypothetical protein DNTS_023650 [Danionella cerebrum]|uniref:Uncharacterized protein n=1 Tax=Danionella cerebrum TaxID=2873325 RepID=A0A553QY94_9TELE|nr:hypothetical protein DNTS_023650 [Danionella translucida]
MSLWMQDETVMENYIDTSTCRLFYPRCARFFRRVLDFSGDVTFSNLLRMLHGAHRCTLLLFTQPLSSSSPPSLTLVSSPSTLDSSSMYGSQKSNAKASLNQ